VIISTIFFHYVFFIACNDIGAEEIDNLGIEPVDSVVSAETDIGVDPNECTLTISPFRKSGRCLDHSCKGARALEF
jgi:hypothetical protein